MKLQWASGGKREGLEVSIINETYKSRVLLKILVGKYVEEQPSRPYSSMPLLPSANEYGRGGRVLQRCELEAERFIAKAIKGVQEEGGTLMTDGAKNIKVQALNTVLVPPSMRLFVQSTNASGDEKVRIGFVSRVQISSKLVLTF